MNQYELLTRLGNLKNNFRKFFEKEKNLLIKIEEKEMDHFADDLPLTINRDPGPNVNYYSTKNSSIHATE
jgi:hypothetical protein